MAREKRLLVAPVGPPWLLTIRGGRSTDGAEQDASTQNGVRRQAETPLRNGELGGKGAQGLDRPLAQAVEVPIIGSVGCEVERSVGSPFGLEDRFVRAARDANGIFDAAVVSERARPELGGVPRHVRVVPAEPAELRPVGTDAWRRVKIVPFYQHAPARVVTRHVERDQGVHVFGATEKALVLAHANEPLPLSI